MTIREQAAFDEAARLNHCAGVLLKHGYRYEAHWYLYAAAGHAVTPEAREALRERARALKVAVLWDVFAKLDPSWVTVQ